MVKLVVATMVDNNLPRIFTWESIFFFWKLTREAKVLKNAEFRL